MLSYILCQMLAVKIWGFRPILRGSVGFLFGWWLLESDLCSDLFSSVRLCTASSINV